MGMIRGERTVEILADPATVFAVAADIERAPAWQSALRTVTAHEFDATGRPLEVTTTTHSAIRDFHSRLRFDYQEPHTISWRQVSGDLQAITGSWQIEQLDAAHTRATYTLAADPGRIGMLLSGRIERQVRDYLVDRTAEALKAHVEASARI